MQTQSKAQTDGRDRVLEDTVKEVNDQNTRETNVIVFRAPAINTNLKETRIKADHELVAGLCNDVCSENVDTDDIAKVMRLGKRKAK